MAFVVAKPRGVFEIRESRSTPDGPRSKTLASFRELTDETLEKAGRRTAESIDEGEIRRAARRVGAPVQATPADGSARVLISELGKGKRLDPTLRDLLLDLLGDGTAPRSSAPETGDAVRSVAAWMDSTPRERGNALVDLLLLADAVPSRGRRREPLEFPRLDSRSHG